MRCACKHKISAILHTEHSRATCCRLHSWPSDGGGGLEASGAVGGLDFSAVADDGSDHGCPPGTAHDDEAEALVGVCCGVHLRILLVLLELRTNYVA